MRRLQKRSCDTRSSRTVWAILRGRGLQVSALNKLKLGENSPNWLWSTHEYIIQSELYSRLSCSVPGIDSSAERTTRIYKTILKVGRCVTRSVMGFYTLWGTLNEKLLLMLLNCNIIAQCSGLTHCIPGVSKNSKAIIFLFWLTSLLVAGSFWPWTLYFHSHLDWKILNTAFIAVKSHRGRCV